MRHTRRLKRGGGFFDFFKKKENPKIKQNNNYKTIKNTYFKRKTEQFPKQYFKYWFAKMKPEIVPKNNSLLNNAFGKVPTSKASNYEVVQDNNNLEKKRQQENKQTANTITHEMISLEEGLQYAFVFAYQKMKNIPLNNTILRLTPEQLNELRATLKNAINNRKSFDEIAVEVFNCKDENEFNDQLKKWESPNNLIKVGNVVKISQSYAGFLGRLIPHILRTDKELRYVYNSGIEYQCNELSSNTSKTLDNNCIIVYKNLNNYNLYSEGLDNKLYIIINIEIPQNFLIIKSNKFMMTSYIKDTFSEGLMLLIHPRLGFIIQKEYPEIWSNKYWMTERRIDSIDRIVILTLQKYSALRRYFGASYIPSNSSDRVYDQSWCSLLYKSNPFEPYIAYELKNPQISIGEYPISMIQDKSFDEEFLKELIDNQVWANSANEEDYKRRKVSGDTYGIRYRTFKDLDKLLPTSEGFKPKFFWQFYDSKNKDTPKILLRHKNILYNIAEVKRNRNRNVTSSKIARKLGDTWKNIERMKHTPQYATQQAMDSYYRNFFNTSPSPLFPRLLTKIQGKAPKPSMPPRLTRQNSKRMSFEPKYIRRTRKNRK